MIRILIDIAILALNAHATYILYKVLREEWDDSYYWSHNLETNTYMRTVDTVRKFPVSTVKWMLVNAMFVGLMFLMTLYHIAREFTQ